MVKICKKRLKMKIQMKAMKKVMMENIKTVMKKTLMKKAVQMQTEVSDRLVFKNNFNLIIHQQIKKSFKENLHLN